jgi:hypothetical protein
MLNVNNFTTLKPEVKAYFALKVMVMSNIAKVLQIYLYIYIYD